MMGLNETQTTWLEKLRDRSFKQGRGQLYHPMHQTYCCIGVLCKVQTVLEGDFGGNGLHFTDEKLTVDEVDEGYIPSVIRDAVGLKTNHLRDLVKLNDDDREPFSSIADRLEAYWTTGADLR
jgi:hypothetical protein